MEATSSTSIGIKSGKNDEKNPSCDSTATVDESYKNKFTEGKASIIVGNSDKVFYNPVQEFNRDLSVAVLSVFSKTCSNSAKNGDSTGISVLEALSATGLRAIRFALEVPNLKEVIANDISYSAVEMIKTNIIHNNVETLVHTSHNDASLAMHLFKSQNKLFDAVDLDPYGCPTRFLDAAVQSVAEGGILMVTCTDMAILAGNAPETCYLKYGAVSVRSPACHELALRIALQSISSEANKYGRYIVPLVSVSADFYIRVFVQIFKGQLQCKETISKLSHVLKCVGCKSIKLIPLGTHEKRATSKKYVLSRTSIDVAHCQICQSPYQIAGPIWTGLLHDKDFVKSIIDHVKSNESKFNTSKRIIGMLSIIENELDDPLYYTTSSLCSIIHCQTIPIIDLRSALLNAGYHVSESHASTNSVKTDAPVDVVWNVIKAWALTKPISKKWFEKDAVTKSICSLIEKCFLDPENAQEVPDNIKNISFNYHKDAALPTYGLLRYQMNPRPNWGPGVRAVINSETVNAAGVSRKKNQCKRRKLNDPSEENSTGGSAPD